VHFGTVRRKDEELARDLVYDDETLLLLLLRYNDFEFNVNKYQTAVVQTNIGRLTPSATDRLLIVCELRRHFVTISIFSVSRQTRTLDHSVGLQVDSSEST